MVFRHGKRLRSIWTIVDLRNKILFTVGLLLVYRVLAHITVPLTHQEQVNLAIFLVIPGAKNPGQLLRPVGLCSLVGPYKHSLSLPWTRSVYYGHDCDATPATNYSGSAQPCNTRRGWTPPHQSAYASHLLYR